MILNSSTKLEAVLAGAVSANQPEFHVTFAVYNDDSQRTPPITSRGALNSSTDVTLLAAANNNQSKDIEEIFIYNKDTATVTCTVKTDDGTERILVKQSLLTTETLAYIKGAGWQIL